MGTWNKSHGPATKRNPEMRNSSWLQKVPKILLICTGKISVSGRHRDVYNWYNNQETLTNRKKLRETKTDGKMLRGSHSTLRNDHDTLWGSHETLWDRYKTLKNDWGTWKRVHVRCWETVVRHHRTPQNSCETLRNVWEKKIVKFYETIMGYHRTVMRHHGTDLRHQHLHLI